MESLSKLSHDPLVHTTLPSTLMSKHLHLTFLELLRFSTVILLTSIETLFILQQWKPFFHFLFFILKTFLSKPPSVYLVDFSCLKPPSFCRVPFSSFLENSSMFEFHDAESLSFMTKILTSSGLGKKPIFLQLYTTFHPKPNNETPSKKSIWFSFLSWKTYCQKLNSLHATLTFLS
jgi:3-ketoacyl-CoA synthase